jgi:hypothetical protein
MIQLDITRLLPRPAFKYLLGLIPGIFFEISLVSVRPAAFRTLAGQAGLGYWTSLGVATFVAFIVGTSGMLVVWILQACIGYLHGRSKRLWAKFLTRLFTQRKLPPSPSWVTSGRWLSRAFQRATFPRGLSEAQRTWHRAARRLLQEHYGIEPPDIQTQADWGVWYWALGSANFPELRGAGFFSAMHATGWCGLAALRLEPALRTKSYVGLSLFLIFCGLVHAWSVSRWWHNPVQVATSKVRGLLAEIKAFKLAKASRPSGDRPDGYQEADDGETS